MHGLRWDNDECKDYQEELVKLPEIFVNFLDLSEEEQAQLLTNRIYQAAVKAGMSYTQTFSTLAKQGRKHEWYDLECRTLKNVVKNS